MTYQITLAGDGTVFSADADETILNAALSQGVRLPYGCNNGLCFGCLQEIVSGETNYREPVMDVGDLLKYQTMLCRAHATSDVVLGGEQLPELHTEVVKNSIVTNDTLLTQVETNVIANKVKTDNEQPQPVDAQRVFADAAQPVTFPVKVMANQHLCDDTRQVDLQVPDWVDLRYLAGQYLDVILDNGERRSFSIANAYTESKVVTLYIKQVNNGFFTSYVFDYLTVNTILTVEAPLGNFVLRNNERPILMLGGSTGISPLLAMLQQLKAQGDTRRVYVYFGVRFAQRLFVDQALTELVLQQPTISYTPVVSRPNQSAPISENKPDIQTWGGRDGYVQTVAIADFGDLSAFDIYISGSPMMVDAATRDCLAAGAQHESVYLDIFSYQSEHTAEPQAGVL